MHRVRGIMDIPYLIEVQMLAGQCDYGHLSHFRTLETQCASHAETRGTHHPVKLITWVHAINEPHLRQQEAPQQTRRPRLDISNISIPLFKKKPETS